MAIFRGQEDFAPNTLPEAPPVKAPVRSTWTDEQLLKLAEKAKKESFQHRSIWERLWMRNIHFVNFRQWIMYVAKFNEYRDIRTAKHVPRPVSTKPREVVQALRAMFSAVNIGASVRPNGSDPKNIAVASIADDYNPVLHAVHDMDSVLNESDYWFLTTGNSFLHTYFEYDTKHGYDTDEFEACTACGVVTQSSAISEAGNVCPDCGNNAFTPATDPDTGEPLEPRIVPRGKGVTIALSPFEILFPNTYSRFEDVPYVIRLRWRSREYYENHPVLGPMFEEKRPSWQKAPSEQSLQLFRSLPHQNESGVVPFTGSSSNTGAGSDEEGLPEYELWHRPCDAYPDGLVIRWAGDSSPILLHLEETEAIPGPLPYRDADGAPLFTFTHAAFEQVGGRIYGTGPIDAIVPIVQQLNQLDSHFMMIIGRMSNPLWLVPKGSEIERFTGEPGLVVKWNPLTVGGNAKPERIAGEGPHGSFFQIRDMYEQRIEQAAGTQDILKGQKPAGVEAYAALDLLKQLSESRFSSAFKARGNLYKDWFKFALEIEREFGPDERTKAILSPARTYTLETFKRAQLQGSFSVVVEDGSQTQKTTLGIRAAVEHLNSLGFVNPQDPDQKYKIYQLFGLSELSPGLDRHVQKALQKQEAFEKWAQDPAAQQESFAQMQQAVGAYEQQLAQAQPDPMTGAPAIGPPPSPTKFTPLEWKPWYNAAIHRQEFLKWTNGDRVGELLAQNPALEAVLVAALTEMDMALQQQMMLEAGPQPARPGGGIGQQMANSNAEAGGSQNVPAGNKISSQGKGPS